MKDGICVNKQTKPIQILTPHTKQLVSPTPLKFREILLFERIRNTLNSRFLKTISIKNVLWRQHRSIKSRYQATHSYKKSNYTYSLQNYTLTHSNQMYSRIFTHREVYVKWIYMVRILSNIPYYTDNAIHLRGVVYSSASERIKCYFQTNKHT